MRVCTLKRSKGFYANVSQLPDPYTIKLRQSSLLLSDFCTASVGFNLREWESNVDVGPAWDSFFEQCAEAGPDHCAFYEPTSEAILDRFDRLIANLTDEPVVETNMNRFPNPPRIYTISWLRRTIHLVLYNPHYMFNALAHLLVALESGSADGVFPRATRLNWEHFGFLSIAGA